MDSNYFNSKKYIILLILICLLFVILIIKAFDYMPKPAETYGEFNTQQPMTSEQLGLNNTNNYDNNETADTEEDADEEDNDEDEDEASSESTSEEKYRTSQSAYTNEFIEIPAPPGTIEEEITVIDTN